MCSSLEIPRLRRAGNGENAIGALPGASMFIAYPVTKKLTVGFGTFSLLRFGRGLW